MTTKRPSISSLSGFVDRYMKNGRLYSETRVAEIELHTRPAPFRTDPLRQAGINPMSPEQIRVIEATFRGADYVVKYLPR
jgi:hypothetical protein